MCSPMLLGLKGLQGSISNYNNIPTVIFICISMHIIAANVLKLLEALIYIIFADKMHIRARLRVTYFTK